MKLTKAQAIYEHRKMWRWLADNPGMEKREYLKIFGYEDINSECFCCEYVAQNTTLSGCKDCPIEWPYRRCIAGCGLYIDWKRAFKDGDYYKAAVLASQIANLPEREEK